MEVYSVVKQNLLSKFEQIRNKMILAIDQLTDDQVNWRPNKESNSIANLIVHIEGNIQERISSKILGEPNKRNRDQEFDENMARTKEELKEAISKSFQLIINSLSSMTEADMLKVISIKNTDYTVLDIFLMSTSHFSEHLGQIFYIAKTLLEEKYVTTSIPKKR